MIETENTIFEFACAEERFVLATLIPQNAKRSAGVGTLAGDMKGDH
ncbi:hypothetical protein ACFQ1L_12475 [Phytohabitans flavus]|nr:hypothetical protein [Phytohabitans flavus]